MLRTTRREFLTKIALAAAGPLALARTASAIDPIGRTRPSHLKLSLAAYLLPRLPHRSEEDDGPVRLRRPGRRPGPGCGRADLVLLPRKRLVRLPESAQDARLPARARRLGHGGHERFLPSARPRGRQGGGPRPHLDRPRGRTRRADDPGPQRQLAPGNARRGAGAAGDPADRVLAALRGSKKG